MAILDFQKPDKVVILDSNNNHGKFEFKPLEPGYGVTIGNSLRRILLSSLEGFAITSVKINGVDHEFSTIKGVIEDVTEIVLNLKQVRFRQQIKDMDQEIVNINITGQDKFTAADISKFTSAFQVLNPDLIICNMDKKVKLQMELKIEKGRGYVPAEEFKMYRGSKIGEITLDAVFTPIKNVKYNIENCRVGQKTDYEKLIIEITTDGSIEPKEALKEAAKILIHHFSLFTDERVLFDDNKSHLDYFDEKMLHMRQLLKTPLKELGLSVRALNCLNAADIETLGDLVSHNKEDFLKIRNFGKKSLNEVEQLVEAKGLSFGLDVSKYHLEKD